LQKYIRILGWIYIVLCGPALVFGLAICAAFGLQPSASNREALQFLGPPFLILACLVLIPGLVGGIGLLRSCRWARVPILLLSAIFLPLLPFTALGVYGFWTLLHPEARVPSVGSERAGSSFFKRAPSPLLNLIVVMVCVAAGFFLVIKVGFVIHHDPQPAPIASNALTATAVLILLVGTIAATFLVIQSGSRVATKARYRRTAQESAAAQAEARRRRAAELLTDPTRAKYTPLVERGEDWSDEKIAYNETPDMTATCEHLQLVERTMRGTGILVRLYKYGVVMAKCRVDYTRLQRAFQLASPVRYAEFYRGESVPDEVPTAYLICDEHKSMIHTVHPEETGANDMSWFPVAENKESE
jgi:hypothetical protein